MRGVDAHLARDVGEHEEPQHGHHRLRRAHKRHRELVGQAVYLGRHEDGGGHEQHDAAPDDAERHPLGDLNAHEGEQRREDEHHALGHVVGQHQVVLGVREQKRPRHAHGEAEDADADGDAPQGQSRLDVGHEVVLDKVGLERLAVDVRVARVEQEGDGASDQGDDDARGGEPCRVAHELKHD